MRPRLKSVVHRLHRQEVMMAVDVYQQLARHLDQLPAGFPPTDSGVELRLLRHLFSPEEAAFAIHLTLIPEEARVVARRAGIRVKEAARRLEAMARKGLVFRIEATSGRPVYMAAQYAIGIWEFQVNRLTPALVRDMAAYIPSLKDTAWKRPQLRTIPIGQSLHHELVVLPHEKAEALIDHHEKFAVNPCICRRERRLVGEGCGKPEDVCLTFGIVAEFMVRNGCGRASDKQEVLEIIRCADESGLVLQPGNAREVLYLCCCCGCCCAALRTIKRLPTPTDWVTSPFLVAFNRETCEGCGVCLERCPMEAIRQVDGQITVDSDRCIGCGLCVSTCPSGSLSLKRQPENYSARIPKDTMASLYALGRARGKLNIGRLLRMQVKSKVDRVLAPR
jgi:ferredoxin